MTAPFANKFFYGAANALLFGLIVVITVFESVSITGFMPTNVSRLHTLHGSYVSLHPVMTVFIDWLYVVLFAVHLWDFTRWSSELDRHDRKLADTHLAVAVAYVIGRVAISNEHYFTATAFAFFQVVAVHAIMGYFEMHRAVGFGDQIFRRGSNNKVFMWNWIYFLAPTSLHHLSTTLTTALKTGQITNVSFNEDWAVAVFVIFAAMTAANEHPVYRVSQLLVTFSWVMNRTGQTRLLAAGCAIAVYIILSLAKNILSGDWRTALKGDSDAYKTDPANAFA